MKIYRGLIINPDPYEGADTTLLEVFALSRNTIIKDIRKYLKTYLQIYDKEEVIKNAILTLKLKNSYGLAITKYEDWDCEIEQIEVKQ
jgi:hypothetical protein